MQDNSRVRLPKIGLRNNNGAIQLRFTYQGQQYALTGLGKYDDLVALQNAKGIVEKIKLDLLTGGFPVGDCKLGKYSLHKATVANHPTATLDSDRHKATEYNLAKCWELYKSLKPDTPQSTRQCRWRLVDKVIANYPDLLSFDKAEELFLALRAKYKDNTILVILGGIVPAVNKAVSLKKATFNPYSSFFDNLDIPSKTITALSKKEIKIIVQAFKDGRFDADKSAYSSTYYAPLVEFRFLTGCRPSEAIGLTWDNIKWKGEDKCQIVFDSRYSYGEVLEGTKNGIDARIFNCNKQLREFLQSIPKIPNRHNLVFPSCEGGYINSKNFSRRQWKPTVEKLIQLGEVETYLPWYDQRHTFGTHVARSTIDLKTLSSIMGNSPDTLMKNYLAKDNDSDFVPEF